jgi:hypothetical protein
MSAEGPQEPKQSWEKVRLLKTNAGLLWYRTKTGEVVVLDDAAEMERDRQNDEPGTPPQEGYPEFSGRIGTEELPVTDANEIEQKRADLHTLVNNLVDISTDLRTNLVEEIVAAEDDGDLEAIRQGIDQLLKDKRDAARAAGSAAGPAGGAAGGAAGAGAQTVDQLYDETKQKHKDKTARKRAMQRAERDAIAELDAEESAANPLVPKTDDEVFTDIEKAEADRLSKRDLEDRAKKKAKDAFDAAKAAARVQAEQDAQAENAAKVAAELALDKDYYNARFDNLRLHGIIDDTNAVFAQDEVANAQTSEALRERFDTELQGLESRLPENPAPPDHGINAVRNDTEFAQMTVEAIRNIEAVIAVGGNANSLYQRYRKRLRAGDLKQFDTSLARREKLTGKQFGIDYRTMTPAERLRIMNPPPGFANRYTANGRIDRIWMAHDSAKYKDLVPFSMEEIRTDDKKKVLYDRFMKAIEYDNSLKATVEAGQPFDDAQRQLQEYSQYEFTYQYKRAEVLSEMFTPEFTKKLIYQNEFVNSIAVMYGVEKTAAFLKDDVFRIAVEDLGTFDRLALAASRLQHLGSGRFTAMSRGGPRVCAGPRFGHPRQRYWLDSRRGLCQPLYPGDGQARASPVR